MTIALIGYGEVGRILAEDLRKLGRQVSAHDLKLSDARGDALRTHAREHGVALADSHAQAVRGADLVISAVTASQTVPVAHDVAAAIEKGAFFLDLNSASPGAKIEASLIVNHARRALRRRRGDDLGAAVSQQGAADPRRPRCGRPRAAAA